MVFLVVCPLNEVSWGRVLRDSGPFMRFGERLSYCDPQIPASAGVRPCVCFSVSWVEFSGRLLPVVLGSLWNWRMAGLRSLCLRVVGMVLPSRGSSGGRVVLGVIRGHSPGCCWSSVDGICCVGLRREHFLRGFCQSVRHSVGREAPIAGTVGWCPWECWSQRLRWFDSSASLVTRSV